MSSPIFRCGHPRTPENIAYSSNWPRCRTCFNEYHREYQGKLREANPTMSIDSGRKRRLPDQLDRARRRVAHLESEAQRYGLTHLLEKR